MEIIQLENFLSDEECDRIVELIDANAGLSYMDGGSADIAVYSPTIRNSTTTVLDDSSGFLRDIKQRVADHLQVDISFGQQLEGQRYQEGQYFLLHQDWFDGRSFFNMCLFSGNRTWTFLMYVQDTEEGGETYFPRLDVRIKPRKGLAILWPNIHPDRTVIHESVHEGLVVTKGSKYIVTSWWREGVSSLLEDVRLGTLYRDAERVALAQGKRAFIFKEQLPRLSAHGHMIARCPVEVWGIIQDIYPLLLPTMTEEVSPEKTAILRGEGNLSDMISLDQVPRIRDHILHALLPYCQLFANQPLEPIAVQGIRSYNNGVYELGYWEHVVDRHVSCAIVVDADLNGAENWPFDIMDHNNQWHSCFLHPGDIIFFEGAKCLHGRGRVFQGNNYKVLICHYKLKNWTHANIFDYRFAPPTFPT